MNKTILILMAAGLGAGCGGTDSSAMSRSSELAGTVAVDGSSTVFPITEAVAEEFRKVAPKVRVTVGVSGTGGGFKKFIPGETDISDASRFIKSSEIQLCAKKGRDYIELPVAYDGIAVVVNHGNDFCRNMTVAELRAMWRSDSTAKKWSDIRAGWPERPFKLFAPGQDSGTFDYFTEVVNGKSGDCRADSTFSEDDNVLVRGIAGDVDGIGFFGYAYYFENQGELNIVAIDSGHGFVTPGPKTIADGTYTPLSRPLFIYVNEASSSKPEVDTFVRFYLENATKLASEVGYVGLPPELSKLAKARYAARVTGTVGGQTGPLRLRYQ